VFVPLSGGVVISTDIDKGVMWDAFGVLLASLEDEDSSTVSDSVIDGGGDGDFRGNLQIKLSIRNTTPTYANDTHGSFAGASWLSVSNRFLRLGRVCRTSNARKSRSPISYAEFQC
jgi:hypothetical protein